jgi:hypothetical protein
VRKRSHLATKIQGEDTWTKRSKETDEFISPKKDPAAKKYKGVHVSSHGDAATKLRPYAELFVSRIIRV